MRGGIDELLSARDRFGEKSVWLEMIEEMLTLPENNQPTAYVQNAEFLTGEIEHIPLRNSSVDVSISNGW